jgi:hypothetical protein
MNRLLGLAEPGLGWDELLQKWRVVIPPSVEFGDKTSLVAQVTTRSGLGAGRVFGNVDANYGSFGSAGGSVGLGFGSAKFGNFIALDGLRSGRFLDTPELAPTPWPIACRVACRALRRASGR